ncbi:hypothetical protein [Myxococcus sp. CA039A]|uniref:hypothetical protein n=1 Tax=Myxococcus sp. CA039A TaxID=2741737 RepID=UPI00157B265D|nr:hypothetical protein [Myxococcus sp. CA039A]NTX55887.1 hypothetical protein [Myxococcus sp. CA039A]
MTIQMTIRVRNELGRPAMLTLEPWGEVRALGVDEEVDIQAKGPGPEEQHDGGFVQVDMTADGINVWGWSGSVLEIMSGVPK